ncbi:unnamed protein product, partial [marine sediment metagenome]
TRTKEAGDFFREEKEAEYFSNIMELRENIYFYLKHDKLRDNIAHSAYERLLSGNHTYTA